MSAYRSTIVVAICFLAICIIVAGYINVEYVNGKGPDDMGAMFFTEHELIKLIGPRKEKASFKVIEFKKSEHTNSGLYKVWYKWNGNDGVLLIDYEPEGPHFTSKGIENK